MFPSYKPITGVTFDPRIRSVGYIPDLLYRGVCVVQHLVGFHLLSDKIFKEIKIMVCVPMISDGICRIQRGTALPLTEHFCSEA